MREIQTYIFLELNTGLDVTSVTLVVRELFIKLRCVSLNINLKKTNKKQDSVAAELIK